MRASYGGLRAPPPPPTPLGANPSRQACSSLLLAGGGGGAKRPHRSLCVGYKGYTDSSIHGPPPMATSVLFVACLGAFPEVLVEGLSQRPKGTFDLEERVREIWLAHRPWPSDLRAILGAAGLGNLLAPPPHLTLFRKLSRGSLRPSRASPCELSICAAWLSAALPGSVISLSLERLHR
jgi:hypothetical protein